MAKAPGKMTEESLLLKSFKYYDLDKLGTCTPNEFMKALIKIGVSSINPENCGAIFKLYDKEDKGFLDYKEFVSNLFDEKRKEEPEAEVGPRTEEKIPKELMQQISANKDVFDKIKADLLQQGENSIFDLLNLFMEKDKKGDISCTKEDFTDIVKQLGINITGNEIDKIFSVFNNQDLPYDIFLSAIVGNYNNYKKALVKQAFKSILLPKTYDLSVDEIAKNIFVENHPKVLEGKATSEDVYNDFLDNLELFNTYYTGNKDSRIKSDELVDFYELISMYYEKDADFENLINKFYKIKPFSFKKDKMQWSKEDAEFIAQMENKAFNEEIDPALREALLEKFKNLLRSQGASGIVKLLKAFKGSNESNSLEMDYEEYRKVMDNFVQSDECLPNDITPEDVDTLFDCFDHGNRGFINYKKLLHFLHDGFIPPMRKKVVDNAFSKIDPENKGKIIIKDLKELYHIPNPDFVPDLLDALEIFHYTVRGSRMPFYERNEFIAFYNMISFLFPSDDAFIKYISSTWRLSDEEIRMTKPIQVSPQKGIKIRGQDKNFHKVAPYGTTRDPINYATSNNPLLDKRSEGKSMFQQILNGMRRKIIARGIRGIMGVRRAFFFIDENGSKTIEFNEFKKIFNQSKYKFSDKDIETIFQKFDRDNSGAIDYNEFMDTLLGEISPSRLETVQRVFEKLDKEGKGYISLDDIRYGFNPSEAPQVREGIRTKNEVLADFVDLVEYHFNLLRENEDCQYDGKGQRIIDSNAFIDFFRNISFKYPDDNAFTIATSAEWGLDIDGKYPYQKGWQGYEQ